jgi:hypothetical protein
MLARDPDVRRRRAPGPPQRGEEVLVREREERREPVDARSRDVEPAAERGEEETSTQTGITRAHASTAA